MLAVRVTAVLVDNGPKPHARKSAFPRGAAGAAGFPHLPAAPALPSLPSHNESRTPRGSSAQLPRGVAAVPAPGLWHRLAETPGTGTGTGTSPLRSQRGARPAPAPGLLPSGPCAQCGAAPGRPQPRLAAAAPHPLHPPTPRYLCAAPRAPQLGGEPGLPRQARAGPCEPPQLPRRPGSPGARRGAEVRGGRDTGGLGGTGGELREG